MHPIILRTKYAFHALLWLLDPDVILDVGSMDGSDSKKFKKLTQNAKVVAFEANPDNYRSMCADNDLQKLGIRVVHQLVSNLAGSRSFFVQRPFYTTTGFNRGMSSAMRSCAQDMQTEEVHLDAVRIDSFLKQEYPEVKSTAMWIDVEGYAYEVLEGIRDIQDRVYLMHVEVETKEVWPDQKVESDILALANSMGFIPVARGAHEVQRDLILIKESWYIANRNKISALLHISKWIGPLFSRILMASRQR
jgi:FkbM family methyltransferase